MLFEELPKEMKEAFTEVKCYSESLSNELDNALDKAVHHEEFIELFRHRMIDLISEARDAVDRIYGG